MDGNTSLCGAWRPAWPCRERGGRTLLGSWARGDRGDGRKYCTDVTLSPAPSEDSRAQPLTATGSDHVWAPAGAAPKGHQEFSSPMCGALPLLSEGQVLGLDLGKYFLSKEEYRTEASLTIHSLQSGWRHKRFWGSQLWSRLPAQRGDTTSQAPRPAPPCEANLTLRTAKFFIHFCFSFLLWQSDMHPVGLQQPAFLYHFCDTPAIFLYVSPLGL